VGPLVSIVFCPTRAENAVVPSRDMPGGFPSLPARNSSAVIELAPSSTPALDVVHKSSLQCSWIVSQC
jgi:hypothetical protein